MDRSNRTRPNHRLRVRAALAALAVINVLLFVALRNGFGGLLTDSRDPARLGRQINSDQVRIAPAPEAR